MKRKLSDEIVVIIKEMLSIDYKIITVIDVVKHNFGVSLTNNDVNNIRKGMAYCDLRPDLNYLISKNYMKSNVDYEKVCRIKKALAAGEPIDKIITTFNTTASHIKQIIYGYSGYNLIASEYNSEIRARKNSRKVINIDERLVSLIKKEFVINNGEISRKSLSETYNVETVTIGKILHLNIYKQYGSKYNLRIMKIYDKKEKLRIATLEKKKKDRIKKEVDKIKGLTKQLRLLNNKISDSKRQFQILKVAI